MQVFFFFFKGFGSFKDVQIALRRSPAIKKFIIPMEEAK